MDNFKTGAEKRRVEAALKQRKCLQCENPMLKGVHTCEKRRIPISEKSTLALTDDELYEKYWSTPWSDRDAMVEQGRELWRRYRAAKRELNDYSEI